MQSIISNFESLSGQEITKYAGEWIAIIDNKIVAHSSSFKEVYEFAKKNYSGKKPLIGKLPEAMPVVFSLK